jgi:CheY-like chemotaxis protein
MLEGLGYTVMLAKDGQEAVEMYEGNSERIKALLFDIVMPRLGGAEAYEQIRQVRGDVPLVFMTGYSPESVGDRFGEQVKSVDGLKAAFIQKPYSLDKLGRTVRKQLDASLAMA